jgi:serine/threonine-protein kinase
MKAGDGASAGALSGGPAGFSSGLPARIGKYLIRGRLGEGAMGVVYRAFDPHIQREVAVKVIRRHVEDLAEDASREDSLAARFRNEARAVGRIAHPGVVTIHDFGEVTPAQSAMVGPRGGIGASRQGYAFLVMELVDGRGLDQVLKHEMPTPPLPWSLGVMDQLLDALACAHGQGVWHRDIKPGNLLITRDDRVKLTDFGIARIADRHLTQAASQIGTPGYMAPEQYLGGPIDQRADLFACGVLLYRLASGCMPFSGAPEAVMYQTLNQEPPAPSSLRPSELPAGLDALVRRAMAREPRDRFADAASMRAALTALTALAAPSHGAADGSDDRTVLLTPPARTAFAPTLAMLSRAESGGASTGSTKSIGPAGAGQAGGLDTTLVAQVERALATHIGPLAKHLVARELARSCSGSVEDLSHSLARHIADTPEREQFIATTAALAAAAASAALAGAEHGTGSGTVRGTILVDAFPAQHAPVSMPADAGDSEEAPTALSTTYLRAITEALALQLGPIARMLVQQAARGATDRHAFLRRLEESVPESAPVVAEMRDHQI